MSTTINDLSAELLEHILVSKHAGAVHSADVDRPGVVKVYLEDGSEWELHLVRTRKSYPEREAEEEEDEFRHHLASLVR